MKKTVSILHIREISLTDLLFHLLRNAWVILLIAAACAMTAYSMAGAAMPEQYTDSITLSVRSTVNTEKWSDQFNTSAANATNLVNAINNKTVSTDFASNQLDKKLNVTVSAASAFASDAQLIANEQQNVATNLITVTVTAATHDEVYLYLSALAEHANTLVSRANLKNLSITALTSPTIPDVGLNYSTRPMLTLLAALAGGLLACALLIAIRLLECRPVTRRAADRLLILPVAGALNRGARGRTTEACLPLPSSETANGSYVQNLTDAAAFLLGRNDRMKYIQAVALSSKAAHKPNEKDGQAVGRLALNLALAMTDLGARVCLADKTGESLALLGIEKCADKQVYSVNEKLTVCTCDIEAVQADGFDRVISALPVQGEREDYHTLWCLPADRFTAEQINEWTAPDEGKKGSASLLIYRLYTSHDAEGLPKDESDDDEVDLLRWGAASLKAIFRIRKGWLVLFGLATVTALALGIGMRLSNYRMETSFSVATADLTSAYASDALEAMTAEDAIELMAQGIVLDSDIKGNALYPTSRVIDVDLLMTEMNALWNSDVTRDAVKRYMGQSEGIDFSVDENDMLFTLTVSGSDREKLEEITRAFFAVAPNVSAYTAGGLTFFADESVTVSADASMVLILAAAWILVILVGIVYALTAGYRDRSLYCGYEVQEAVGVPVVGKCRTADRKKRRSADADSLNPKEIDVALAQFVRGWAESIAHEQCGETAVLTVTSALRNEGSARLARTVETLLRQNGLTVKRADRALCTKLLEDGEIKQSGCDVLLIDCPGMAVEPDAQKLAEKADGILWALRVGYADRARIVEAVKRLNRPEKLLGCVMTDGN